MNTRRIGSGTLVIATHNAGKLKEISALLDPYGVKCISAGSLGLPEPPENDDLLGHLSPPIRERVKERFRYALEQIYNPPPDGCAGQVLTLRNPPARSPSRSLRMPASQRG